MKFDIIIGNPPYQKESDGTATSMQPIYQNFIELGLTIGNIVSFIVPSRWMQGGKNLEQFRYNMINSNKFKYIIDYQISGTVFPTIGLDGGISYFLIDNNYSGNVNYTFIDKNNKHFTEYRKLNYEDFGFVIRDIRQLNIIRKARKFGELTFDSIVSERNCYGFATDLFNRPELYKSADLQQDYKDGYNKVYGVLGGKGAIRVSGYIHPESILKHKEYINKYNILFGYAYSMQSTKPADRILSKPGELCTETFLNIGPFDTAEEQLNCEEYIKTKFFRALLFFHRFQKNTTYKTFEFIPIVDFNKQWSDEELYSRYDLTSDEIDYIEQLIVSI